MNLHRIMMSELCGLDLAKSELYFQTVKHERHRLRKTSANAVAKRSQSWRPSLQSIYEAAS